MVKGIRKLLLRKFLFGLIAVSAIGAIMTVSINGNVDEHVNILALLERAQNANYELEESLLRAPDLDPGAIEGVSVHLRALTEFCRDADAETAPSSLRTPELRTLIGSFCKEIGEKSARLARAPAADLRSEKLRKSLEHLTDTYIGQYRESQARAHVFQYFLAALCVGLLGWLFHVFRRLNGATARLDYLNQTLERQVAERTRELSQALRRLEDNQELLAQSAKMTALGEMAGGIAHEINTPLAAISMNADFILERLDEGDPALTRKRAEAILRIVDRVSKIVKGLRRFTRAGENTPKQPSAVGAIVEDTLSLCAESMKAQSVEVRTNVETNLSLVCVPEQISQVLLNFLNNSLDALKTSVPVDHRWIQIDAQARGGEVEISVTDAGGGIPENLQAKLMQPFFTTKPAGFGTGLGLSISRSIVEGHGGHLVYDRESANTRFVMRFPVAA